MYFVENDYHYDKKNIKKTKIERSEKICQEEMELVQED